MLLSFFVSPIAMITLGLVHEAWLLVAAMFALGFFMDLYRPAVNAAVIDMVPPGLRTRAFGYIYWAINLGAALAPIAAGVMANYDYFLLFLGDALTTALFGVIVVLRLPRITAGAPAWRGARRPEPALGSGRSRASPAGLQPARAAVGDRLLTAPGDPAAGDGRQWPAAQRLWHCDRGQRCPDRAHHAARDPYRRALAAIRGDGRRVAAAGDRFRPDRAGRSAHRLRRNGRRLDDGRDHQRGGRAGDHR